MKVAVGSRNPVKVRAVRRALSRFFNAEVFGVEVSSGVSPQPMGFEETFRGALNRAKSAYTQADWGVGIEAGLIYIEPPGNYFDIQICVIYDGSISTGLGPGFVYPPKVIEEVLEGREVGEVMEELTGIEDIGKKIGAIGYLTTGKVTREEITEQSVLMALVPRIRAKLFGLEKQQISKD